MKIITASNGKKTVKMSKSEWTAIGKKAGWMKVSMDNWLSEEDKKETELEFLEKKLDSLRNEPVFSYATIKEIGKGIFELQLERKKFVGKFHKINDVIKQYLDKEAEFDKGLSDLDGLKGEEWHEGLHNKVMDFMNKTEDYR